MSAPAGLVVRGLAYAYPDGRQALFGVDLDVSPGERLAILGPNGAGKTTLVLHLNGILGTDAGPGTSQGSVHVGDVLVARQNLRQVRQRVGLVFQDPDDQLFMPTVRQDVGFGPANLGLTGDELDARVTQALAQVDMAGFEDRAPYHLSFGQRRRVAVATVLAMHPDVVVLDEPAATWTLPPAGSSPTCCSRSTSLSSWSRTTCRTRCSCARASVVLSAASSSPTGPPTTCCATSS